MIIYFYDSLIVVLIIIVTYNIPVLIIISLLIRKTNNSITINKNIRIIRIYTIDIYTINLDNRVFNSDYYPEEDINSGLNNKLVNNNIVKAYFLDLPEIVIKKYRKYYTTFLINNALYRYLRIKLAYNKIEPVDAITPKPVNKDNKKSIALKLITPIFKKLSAFLVLLIKD